MIFFLKLLYTYSVVLLKYSLKLQQEEKEKKIKRYIIIMYLLDEIT